MKALFLCTEVAGYFANCITAFQKEFGAEVCLVYIPNGPQAPFKIKMEGIQQIDKSTLTDDELIRQCMDFNPDIVYVTGWQQRSYKRVCRKMRSRDKPVVCGVDNVWKGSMRQRAACLFSGWVVRPYFSHMWVAGHRQYQFARRLGYSYTAILTGLYAADVEKFSAVAASPLTHYLVYVGRFEKIKGVDLLYTVFSALTDEERNGWKLKMIGNGSMKPFFSTTSTIEIHPFMQPEELISFVADAGGFILPSHHEPWGVVVQEFAAAGKPILLSNQVNSGEDYLIHKYNGFVFEFNNPSQIKAVLKQFFKLTDSERQRMGQRSCELASLHGTSLWAAKLASINQRYDVI